MIAFDPLDEKYRWCVYCQADCWPEPENQRHDSECPTNTGIYPVRAEDALPTGDLGACTACSQPFALGDFYVHVSDESGLVVSRPEVDSRSWIACVPCGITQVDPRT
ncbi:hypothetical protein C8D88_116103 [Lentzea atacamensis]|uniref:Uncharacterized protein n=1 Tax=Lentzea atacamensis TaxID=531938 RepID=A0A316HTT6_9PSEU|nr:hypothetical protein [Lentzea atacamensis]PWK81692.1 hypothetical protein C8D88_116103 [Lentzea atacamensis]